MSSSRERVSSFTGSSEDDSSDSDPPPAKKPRSFSLYMGSVSDSQTYSDRGSTIDHDDFSSLLSDDDNQMNKMVKVAKPKPFGDNKAQKMMERMGYQVGHGLGKHAQGRVDPVEMSKQRGRRGLGLHIKGLEAASLEWNSNMEVVSVEEEVSWLEEENHQPLLEEDLSDWIIEGSRKETIDDETEFCDTNLLRNVLSSKSVFDHLEPEEMRKARTRSNPFETIRGGIFLNRAAMKMANMDKVFDFMFTSPKDEKGEELVGPDDLLYFADVCAGPGGFSEYVLWRRKWHAKGFGFTLKGENDFRLSEFHAGPCETFEPHYGVGGVEGDGNVFNPENILTFKRFVMNQTCNEGVHFMMADGGFSVDGRENIQEILSKQLYLCQFLVALSIVRIGGHFVCKLFDVFTPFSVGLVFLMYKAFQKISIHKPNTSRPANSERYIICKWKRDDCESITDYMFGINERLWKFGTTSERDITEIVPLSVLKDDDAFYNYIVESNNSLGERQVVNLVKIATFCRDSNLSEPRQAEMRKACLQYWEVDDRVRTAPQRLPPEVKATELFKKALTAPDIVKEPETELKPNKIQDILEPVYDWHCVVLGSARDRRNCYFYLGLGRSRVFRWDNGRWHKVDGSLELSPDTLVYGELVDELLGEGRSQRKIFSLHIIDAIFLGGVDVHRQHLTNRRALCHKFAQALYKPSRTDLTPIRVKEVFDLEDVENVFHRLELRQLKGSSSQRRLVYQMDHNEERFIVPGGLLFLNATQAPWKRHLSKTHKIKYYHNYVKKDSKFDRDRPADACADFANCFRKRYIWWWEEGVVIHENHSIQDPEKLQRKQLMDFIDSRIGQA